MTSIGETLRRERVRRNLDLDRVSRELKISARLLGAIEEERFEKLPGGVFTKSFVRQYAQFLGLDEDEIVGELQRALEPAGSPQPLSEIAKPELEISMPRVKGWDGAGPRFRWGSVLPALAMVVVVMLVCSAVYSWWQRSRRPAPAQETRPVASAPVPAAPTPPEQQTVEPAQASAANPEPVPQITPVAAEAVKPESAPPQAEPAATKQAPVSPPLAAPSNAPVQVQLKADEPVWVSARTDGKYLFSATLAANETRTVEATENVVLRLGNAGGMTIMLNGKPIGPVGPKGQIRTVQLTPGGFNIVAPEPSKPASPTGPAAPLTPGPGAPF
jgi:cytoskeleton protein RodZ